MHVKKEYNPIFDNCDSIKIFQNYFFFFSFSKSNKKIAKSFSLFVLLTHDSHVHCWGLKKKIF